MTTTDEILYISGPMTGMPEYNYPLFGNVAGHFRKQGMTVMSPAEIDAGEQIKATDLGIKPWKYYMTKAITMQMQATAWAGLPGWWRSKGAKREFDLAVDLEHKLYVVKFDRLETFCYLEELA